MNKAHLGDQAPAHVVSPLEPPSWSSLGHKWENFGTASTKNEYIGVRVDGSKSKQVTVLYLCGTLRSLDLRNGTKNCMFKNKCPSRRLFHKTTFLVTRRKPRNQKRHVVFGASKQHIFWRPNGVFPRPWILSTCLQPLKRHSG